MTTATAADCYYCIRSHLAQACPLSMAGRSIPGPSSASQKSNSHIKVGSKKTSKRRRPAPGSASAEPKMWNFADNVTVHEWDPKAPGYRCGLCTRFCDQWTDLRWHYDGIPGEVKHFYHDADSGEATHWHCVCYYCQVEKTWLPRPPERPPDPCKIHDWSLYPIVQCGVCERITQNWKNYRWARGMPPCIRHFYVEPEVFYTPEDAVDMDWLYNFRPWFSLCKRCQWIHECFEKYSKHAIRKYQ